MHMDQSSFVTPAGVPVTAVTAQEMRAVDRVAIEEVGVELLQMMENAGRTLAGQAARVGGGSALVVAGNGGNGGGGMACARHLLNRGVSVDLVLDRHPTELSGVAAKQYKILDEMGVLVGVGPDALPETPPSVAVDALIGYGLSGPVREPANRMVETLNRFETPVISLDVPSGVDATTGEAHGVAVDSERVVTLALPKTGLTDRQEPLVLADISVPRTVYDRLDITYETPFEGESWTVRLR
jgi:NAD(P)H-hydrate epimerase